MAAISRANINRTELAPFLWASSASQEVVNDILDSEPSKRQALPPAWEAPNDDYQKTNRDTLAGGFVSP